MDKVHRLLLVNQYRILEFLSEIVDANELEVADDFWREHDLQVAPKTLARDRIALEKGYSLHYSNLMESIGPYWILEDELDEDQCEYVWDVLEMYGRLQLSYENLDEEARAELKEQRINVEFPGFDGNNETKQLDYAEFISERLRRFDNVQVKDSHHRTEPIYRDMLNKFREIAPRGDRNNLKAEEIKEVVEAGRQG